MTTGMLPFIGNETIRAHKKWDLIKINILLGSVDQKLDQKKTLWLMGNCLTSVKQVVISNSMSLF